MRFKYSFFLILKSNKALFPIFFKHLSQFFQFERQNFCIFRKNSPSMIPQYRVYDLYLAIGQFSDIVFLKPSLYQDLK